MEAPARKGEFNNDKAAILDFSWTATTLNLIPALSPERFLALSAVGHELVKRHAITAGLGLVVLENVEDVSESTWREFPDKIKKVRKGSPKKVEKSAEAILKLTRGEIDEEAATEQVNQKLWMSDTDARTSFLWLQWPQGDLDIALLRRLAHSVETSLIKHRLPRENDIRQAVAHLMDEAKSYLEQEEHSHVETVQLRSKLAIARAVVENARHLTATPNAVPGHRVNVGSHPGSATVFDPLSREEREAAIETENLALIKLDQSTEAIAMIPPLNTGTRELPHSESLFRQMLQLRYRLIVGTELLVHDDVASAEQDRRIQPHDADKLRAHVEKTEQVLAEYNTSLNNGRSNEEETLAHFNALIWPANQRALRAFEQCTATEAEFRDNQLDVARLRSATNRVYYHHLGAKKLNAEVSEAVREVIQQVDKYLGEGSFTDVDTLALQFLINIARYVVH